MIPFWGQRYREYFVDLCLPSLLAPNNIPLLRAEDGHRFLVATTREDWDVIKNMPIMDRLRHHVTLVWIEIDYSPSTDSETRSQYASSIHHHNHCARRLMEVAYRARAYGSLLWPDFIHSDGMVAALLKYAQDGYTLVLCPALRQTEEAVLDDLLKRGLLAEDSRLSLTGQALTVSPRVMAELFVKHLHPEMWGFEERSSSVIPYVPTHWFYSNVPGNRGIILHSFFGIPFLMDYGIVAENHAECLDRNTFEYVYVRENFAHGKTHIVQDSDEFGIVSLTLATVNRAATREKESRPSRWLQRYKRLCNIRESMWHFVGRNRDVLGRELFRVPIRLHMTDLDEVWMNEERRVDRLINYAVGDYYYLSRPPNTNRFPSRFGVNTRILLSVTSIMSADIRERMALYVDSWARFVNKVIFSIRITCKRVGLAFYGDPVALRWWSWRLRKLGARLVGRAFHEPKPPTPE